MRTVRRRATAQPYKPPAPWTFREQMPEGAPRVCRSNLYQQVLIGTVLVGTIDRMLHLYTHWGLTEKSAYVRIDDVWHLIYDLDTEWRVVIESGFWIEYASDSEKAVARVSREDALRFGHKTTHGNRAVWAVPFDKYTVHKRGS